MEPKTIYGTVNKIKFHNANQHFYILDIKTKDNNKITVLGTGVGILKNDYIEAKGDPTVNIYKGKKSDQIENAEIKRVVPQEKETILEYLSSGIIKGVSKRIAEDIVRLWGEESLIIIEEKPHLLKRIKGLGSKKISQIINSWEECKPQENIIKSLIDMGFTSFESIAIYKKFKEQSIQKIQEQPYLLYRKIKTINFEKIDGIALKNGFDKENSERITTGIHFCAVRLHEQNSETVISKQELLRICASTLKVSFQVIENNIDKCLQDRILHTAVNLPYHFQHDFVYEAENEIAQKVFNLYTNKEDYKGFNINTLQKIERLGEKKVPFTEEQKFAILNAINNKISILTGKPGTGKTTVTNEIVKQLEALGRKEILLCAPTGKAAQKMHESTGKPAKTIHRLLEYNPQKSDFDRNIKNPLEADVLIIDEASMIDIFLMANLIRAIHNKTQVIIIGDVNQLASVGCGAVLRDLIESNLIPTAYLNEPMRTGKNSDIIKVAHDICDYGEFNLISSKDKPSDMYFIASDSDHKTLSLIEHLLTQKTETALGFNNYRDAQVLSPIHKGIIGTKNLNMVLKNIINTKIENPEDYIISNGFKYHKYDKVIQIKNNYDKDVFNGDSGFITEIGSDFIQVQFNDQEVFFKKSELNQILPSYSISIHKSQGSEYPLVIIPIPQQESEFIDRSLIYTGITRGKKTVIIIGNKEIIEKSCKNEKNRKRKSNLKEKILYFFQTI